MSTTRERFLAKVTIGEDGCWQWTGGTARGYGRFCANYKMHNAHRWSYEFSVGPIPAGLQLDHLCRNTMCVNPAHLEPVTPQENTLRGHTLAAANAAKTHCPKGHPLSGANLYVTPRGYRDCRACRRESSRHGRDRKAVKS